MADEKIKRDGRPPGFVNMDRGEQTYNGVADTVDLWAQARTLVMLRRARDDPPRDEVIEEFNKLLKLAPQDDVDKHLFKSDENGTPDKNITLGAVGRAALGGEASEDVSTEVA